MKVKAIQNFQEVSLKANITFESDLSFQQTIEIINDKLNWNLDFDDSGYTEECPSFVFRQMNHNYRIIGSSYQKIDTYEREMAVYQLSIDLYPKPKNFRNINLGPNIIPLLENITSIKNIVDNYNRKSTTIQWNFLNVSNRITDSIRISITDAWEIAQKYHKDQKYGLTSNDVPYIYHLNQVFINSLLEIEFLNEIQINNLLVSSILHDLLEDTNCAQELVEDRFGDDVLSIIKAVTKNENLPTKGSQMMDSITRIKQAGPIAAIVKLCDRLSNISNPPPEYWNSEKIEFYINESKLILKELSPYSNSVSANLEKAIYNYEITHIEKELKLKLPNSLKDKVIDKSWQNGGYKKEIMNLLKNKNIQQDLSICFYNLSQILFESQSFQEIMLSDKEEIDMFVGEYSSDVRENTIAPEKTILIGDFGLGSDQPIALDYRNDVLQPEVWMLIWGKTNYWTKISSSFDNFITGKK